MSREGIMILILMGTICIMGMKLKKLNDTIKKINNQIKKIREDNLMLSGGDLELMALILELKDEVDAINTKILKY